MVGDTEAQGPGSATSKADRKLRFAEKRRKAASREMKIGWAFIGVGIFFSLLVSLLIGPLVTVAGVVILVRSLLIARKAKRQEAEALSLEREEGSE